MSVTRKHGTSRTNTDLAAAPVEAGQVCYQDPDSGFRVRPGLANDAFSQRVRGVAINNGGPGQPIELVFEGDVVFDEAPFQPGAAYYLSATTPGALVTESALGAGDYVSLVGLARDERTLYVVNLRSARLNVRRQAVAMTPPPKAASKKSSSKSSDDSQDDK